MTRKVSVPLGVGIFLLPVVFFWFTLRAGYSRTARTVGLAWLGVFVVAAGRPTPATVPPTAPAVAQEAPEAPTPPKTVADCEALVERIDPRTGASSMECGKSLKEGEDINARAMGFNENGIRILTKVAQRFGVKQVHVLDKAIRIAQICLEYLPESLGSSENQRTVRLAQHSLVFVEGISRTARQRQQAPLDQAFALYRLSGCPVD